MKIVMTFSARTCCYAAHAKGCSAAAGDETRGIHAITCAGEFPDVKSAHTWADSDESEKAGESVRANFKACACTRAPTVAQALEALLDHCENTYAYFGDSGDDSAPYARAAREALAARKVRA